MTGTEATKIAVVTAAADTLNDLYRDAMCRGNHYLDVPRTTARILYAFVQTQPGSPGRSHLLLAMGDFWRNTEGQSWTVTSNVDMATDITAYITEELPGIWP